MTFARIIITIQPWHSLNSPNRPSKKTDYYDNDEKKQYFSRPKNVLVSFYVRIDIKL